MKWLAAWKGFFRYQALAPEIRKVTFFSEGAGYWPYFEPIVNKLIETHEHDICYLTSDASDPILNTDEPLIHAFFIGEGSARVSLFRAIKPCVLLTTTPDPSGRLINRSPYKIQWVYLNHTMVSTHTIYLAGAFDLFDSIFCVGPYQVNEIREWEELKNLPQKNLFEHGYGPLDTILSKAASRESPPLAADSPVNVLVAPSWGKQGIIETLGQELIGLLLEGGYTVTLRPHPLTQKLRPDIIDDIRILYDQNGNFLFDEKTTSFDSYFEADIMISDWSGAALEFAFGLERPVLFLDVPKKINNQEFSLMQAEPFESWVRDKIGVIVSPEKLTDVASEIDRLIINRKYLKERIREVSTTNIFNLGRSGDSAAKDILKLADEVELE